MDLGSSRNEEVPKTGCDITDLPNEFLECILLKLSYAEIAQVRHVCRRFRDVGDGILDREFRCLKTRAESHLAALVQEENALYGKPVHSGTGSTGGAEIDSAVPKPSPKWDIRNLLDIICSEIRLLRAVCYRLLFLCEVPKNLRYSSAYFKGNIIDETHHILRLVRSRWVEGEDVKVDLDRFISLVNQWMLLFYKEIEPTSIQHICAQNKSKCPDLFGSNVIDLLETIPECKKDIAVNIDSEGWCYIKGEYKLHANRSVIVPDPASGLEPLTVKQQVKLQNVLFCLARFRHVSQHPTLQRYSMRFAKEYYSKLLRRRNEDLQTYFAYDVDVILKVDLKCRKELAPIELLLELPKEQSYEDNEEESAPGSHTVKDPSPDFELKLQIERGSCPWYPDAAVCKCLIEHRHTGS
jgi:hypothetical protein